MADVPTIIDQQLVVANNYLTQAQGFINRVADLANISFTIDLPQSLGFGATDYTNDALDKITAERPIRPEFEAITLISPTAPVVDFREIDQTLIDAVKATLLYDLENGGYGINNDDEAALWNRERDREAQGTLAEVEEVTRTFAQGGFPMPTGAMLNAIARVQQTAGNKNSSVNRDIGIKRSDLYFEARKFTIQNAQSAQEVVVAVFRALTDQVQAMTAIFASQIQKYRADTDAQVELIRSNLGIYAADVQAFAAVVSAISEAYRLKNQESQLNNAWNVDVIRAKLEEARIKLLSQSEGARVRTGNAQFGAEYYGRTIQAAISSINALAAQTATN